MLLREKFAAEVPKLRARVKELQAKHGNKVVGQINITSVIGGSRELPTLFYEGSSVDAQLGIKFRGMSIPEMQRRLPKIGSQPLPEAVFWLLLTGQVPTQEELKDLTASLVTNDQLPASTTKLIKNHAKTHHPMTTLSMALLDMQNESEFFRGYSAGTLKKDQFWQACLNDGITLLKHIPVAAALIYTTRYDKKALKPRHTDWAGRYCDLLGFKDNNMADALRSYLAIHSDHEGANVSAHTSYLVGSALSDPFLAISAAVNGLAGPLHGLANQESVKFLIQMLDHLKSKGIQINSSTDPALLAEITNFVNDWLKTKVVPGYGHGKLRNTDPRYTHLKNQSLELIPNSELVKVVHAAESVITPLLQKLGKVKNPFPNVDAHSGALLYELGMTEFDYYTVTFAVSRAIGCVANMVWARAIGLPIERPSSLTLEELEEIAAKP